MTAATPAFVYFMCLFFSLGWQMKKKTMVHYTHSLDDFNASSCAAVDAFICLWNGTAEYRGHKAPIEILAAVTKYDFYRCCWCKLFFFSLHFCYLIYIKNVYQGLNINELTIVFLDENLPSKTLIHFFGVLVEERKMVGYKEKKKIVKSEE